MSDTFVANPTIDDIPFEPLRDVYRIWLGVSAEHGLPQRKHFSPQLLKDHLPYLVFIDYERDTDRFRVRLIGTRYSEAIGFEGTGMYIDELPNAAEMEGRYRWMLAHKQPYYAYLEKMVWANREYKHYAVIGCPLYDDDGRISMILFRVTFERLDDVPSFGPYGGNSRR